MESKSNYTVVGLSVLVLGAALLSAALWLSVGFDQKTYKNYITYLDEPASGLSEESAVKFNGVRVGMVNSIEINQKNPEQVVLVLKIDATVPITESTEATLISQGITGNTYLGLSATTPSLVPLKKSPSSPYPVIPSRPSFFYQIEKDIRKIAKEVQNIFSQENSDNIERILKNFQAISETFAKNDHNMDKTLKDLPQITHDLKNSINKFGSMSDAVSTSGNQFTVTMKAGKNSIDQISQQTLPSMTNLMNRLNDVAANLEKISVEMRQNPSVLIRGSAPPKLGPGERP